MRPPSGYWVQLWASQSTEQQLEVVQPRANERESGLERRVNGERPQFTQPRQEEKGVYPHLQLSLKEKMEADPSWAHPADWNRDTSTSSTEGNLHSTDGKIFSPQISVVKLWNGDPERLEKSLPLEVSEAHLASALSNLT